MGARRGGSNRKCTPLPLNFFLILTHGGPFLLLFLHVVAFWYVFLCSGGLFHNVRPFLLRFSSFGGPFMSLCGTFLGLAPPQMKFLRASGNKYLWKYTKAVSTVIQNDDIIIYLFLIHGKKT